MRGYGIYQNIRDASWKCLIQNHSYSLPIDVLKIACNESGVRVIKNSSVCLLAPTEFARSYYKDDVWYIVYDDSRSVPVARYAVAHELGHYFLHHYAKYLEYSSEPKTLSRVAAERQADSFARRLLCPACVLSGLGVTTADEIASLCRVDISIATERAKRLETLREKDSFLRSALERELYERFLPFIQENKKEGAITPPSLNTDLSKAR